MGLFKWSKKEEHKSPEDQARFHYQQGKKAYQKEKYKHARKEILEAIELDPSLSDARKLFDEICIMLALEKSGSIDEIISLLEWCIQVNPDSQVHAELGRIYEWQGRSDDANREYREHLKINPYWEYLPARLEGKLVPGMRANCSNELARRMLGLEGDTALTYIVRHRNWRDIRKSLGIPDPSIEPLIEALKDEDEEARYTAATALQEIGNERAVRPLIEALKDESSDVRHQAVNALGEIGDKRTIESLTEALEDEDENVRQDAEYAIKRIKEKLRDSE